MAATNSGRELKMAEVEADIAYSTFYQEYLLKNQPCILRWSQV
jgi:hypothetical protein